MRTGRLIIGLILALVAYASYYGVRQFNPVLGVDQHVSLTKDQEVALGVQSAPGMADQFGGLDPDPEAQAEVARVGGGIASHSVASETGYQFQYHLLRDPQTVNAFALPGGPIFITRGLYDRLSNEGELAGVLGHETGHVIARHSAQQIAKSQLAQGLVGAAAVAGSDDRGDRRAAVLAAVVAQMVQLRYGRQDEIQADTLGVRLMSEAGFDPRAMVEVMHVLEKSSGGSRQPEFMSSHPDPGNRAGVIREAIARRFPAGVPNSLTTGRQLAANE